MKFSKLGKWVPLERLSAWLEAIEDNCPDDIYAEIQAMLAAAPSAPTEARGVIAFCEAILHGDEDHRRWLREAAQCFAEGRPLPAPYGKGLTEKKIEEAEARGMERAERIAGQKSLMLPHQSDFDRGYANGRSDAAAAIRTAAKRGVKGE